jgi:hypothetical protein
MKEFNMGEHLINIMNRSKIHRGEQSVMYSFVQTLFILLILFTGLSGCASEKENNAELIRETVMRYVRLLEEGFSKRDISVFKGVVSDSQVMVLEHRMNSLTKAGRVMESRLKDIKFLDIGLRADTIADVKTLETWDVRHLDAESGGVKKELNDFVYEVEYRLMQKGDKWLVIKAKALERSDQPGGSSAH